MLNIAEFKRNLWLEFSPQRLVIMPVILGGILLLTHLASEGDPIADYVDTMTGRISVLYALIVLVWGAVLVSRNLNDEIAQNSWDLQRMSSLSGIEMALGKCFGAASYAWYGGLLLMAAHIGVEIYGGVPAQTIARNLAYFLLTGMLVHGTVLMFAALMLRNISNRNKPIGRVFYVFLVIVFSAPLLLLSRAFDAHNGALPEGAENTWYGLAIPAEDMALLTLAMHAAWAMFGAVRMISSELQYRQASLGWPLFLGFCIAWYSGFDWQASPWSIGAALPKETVFAVGFSAIGLYASMMFDRVSIANYRTWFHAIRNKNWGMASSLIPWWLSSYLLLLPSVFATLHYYLKGENGESDAVTLTAITLGTITRDIALFHALSFAGLKRISGSFIIYAALLYLLLPLLCEQLDWEQMRALFLAADKDFYTLTASSLWAQTALLFGLCYWRFNNSKTAMAAAE